jgi:hypothetical protein
MRDSDQGSYEGSRLLSAPAAGLPKLVAEDAKEYVIVDLEGFRKGCMLRVAVIAWRSEKGTCHNSADDFSFEAAASSPGS